MFPTVFKEAIITPLIKKINLSKEDLGNYRPISHLNFVSKIVERVVHSRLVAHLNSFSGLPTFQSAYRQHHSTESALLRIQNDLLRAIDKKEIFPLVLLDLSAAFDTIDHNILISRLQNYFGLSGIVLQFFKSYLIDRKQTVVIGSSKSAASIVSTGVPLLC